MALRAADAPLLSRRQHAAALALVDAVRGRVPAALVQALLFGSRARGEARPDSDLDLLLVFHRLPPDREPQAELAERLAERVGRRFGVALGVWCVSLPDLARGRRTPMLVDALADGLALWPRGSAPPRVGFTPPDALFCVGALLARVDEGGRACAAELAAGRPRAAALRLRDDVVRLCTALLLLRGETRPRRAMAVLRLAALEAVPAPVLPLLRWAAGSYGPGGHDEAAPFPPPPRGASVAVARMRREVLRRVARFSRRLRSPADGPERAGCCAPPGGGQGLPPRSP